MNFKQAEFAVEFDGAKVTVDDMLHAIHSQEKKYMASQKGAVSVTARAKDGVSVTAVQKPGKKKGAPSVELSIDAGRKGKVVAATYALDGALTGSGTLEPKAAKATFLTEAKRADGVKAGTHEVKLKLTLKIGDESRELSFTVPVTLE